MKNSKASRPTFPIWGILSVAMSPLGALFAALAAVTIEGFWRSPYTQSYTVDRNSALHAAILGAVRAVVLATWACVAAGVASAVIAWAKRERPRCAAPN